MSEQITIPAIETSYGGALFRSRLEARWAVFFDHMLIEWEYEPEGYETPDGRYLPDFRIYLRKREHPTALFEVKPWHAAKRGEKCVCPEPLDRRWAHAAGADPAPSLLVACGIPTGSKIIDWVEETGGMHRIKAADPDSHEYPYVFSTCECCSGAVIQACPEGWRPPRLIVEAFDAACSARFEFGRAGR
jgi:hypothetical protein